MFYRNATLVVDCLQACYPFLSTDRCWKKLRYVNSNYSSFTHKAFGASNQKFNFPALLCRSWYLRVLTRQFRLTCTFAVFLCDLHPLREGMWTSRQTFPKVLNLAVKNWPTTLFSGVTKRPEKKKICPRTGRRKNLSIWIFLLSPWWDCPDLALLKSHCISLVRVPWVPLLQCPFPRESPQACSILLCCFNVC